MPDPPTLKTDVPPEIQVRFEIFWRIQGREARRKFFQLANLNPGDLKRLEVGPIIPGVLR